MIEQAKAVAQGLREASAREISDGDYVEAAIGTIDALVAEIERLRASLNVICQWFDGDVGPHMDEPYCAGIARAALEQQK